MKYSTTSLQAIALAAATVAAQSDVYHNQAGDRHYQCLTSVNGTAYLIELEPGVSSTFSSWAPPDTNSSSPQTHPSWTPLTVSEGISPLPALCYSNGTHIFTVNSENGHIVTFDPVSAVWNDPLTGKAPTAQAAAFSQTIQSLNSTVHPDFQCVGVNNGIVCYDDGSTSNATTASSTNDAWLADLSTWNFTAPAASQNTSGSIPSIQGGVLAASDTQAFLFGGQIGANDNTTSLNATKNCNADIWSFDATASQWSVVAQFPKNLTYTAVSDPAVAFYNSSFYIFSGQACTSNSSDEHIENISQDFWMFTPPSTWELVDPIASNQPPSTVGGQLSVLNTTGGSYLVLRSGFNNTNTNTEVGADSTYLFNPSNNSWVEYVGRPNSGNGSSNGTTGANVSNSTHVSGVATTVPMAVLVGTSMIVMISALLL
ncbi:hypothetical protein BC943DRAFT_325391 [Umbelopsis sp. AD052]|nr:hypothetical protein BC943DRAFT_325391 [Umbelopsis sp. AD052]